MTAAFNTHARAAHSMPEANLDFFSFVNILQQRANNTPDALAFAFIQNSSGDEVRLSYRQLFLHAVKLAERLQAHQLQNCRILLVLRSHPLFVIAFLGCLLAGATAVPAPLPRREQLLKRLNDLAQDSGALAVIGDTDDVVRSCSGGTHAAMLGIDLRGIDLEGVVDDGAQRWRAPLLTPDSLALLQYTSGSTGSPKGVMVSHGNLMANAAALQTGLGFTEKTSQFVALPLFHDMGLILGVLEPIFTGSPAYLMSPSLFAFAPQLWLQTISKYRIAISGGPNFMYDLAIESIQAEHLENLDLSCWRVAFCGAEPIKVSTFRAFAQKFAGAGFPPEAFYPCYGMAEITLFATGHERGTPHPVAERRYDNVTRFVTGCGKVEPGHELIIVDPESRCRVVDGTDGEIWLAGPSVAQGYWQKPQATESTFNAWTADTCQGPFLRTGDLGFMQAGELYVTGRLKDLIIIRGRNYAPHDLEQVAEASHAALRPSCSAAFNTLDAEGNDCLVIALELRRNAMRRHETWDDIRNAVRRSILETFQLKLDAVVLLKTASMPKTSSGKLQRSGCASAWRAGTLSVMNNPVSQRLVEDVLWLQEKLAKLLKCSVEQIVPTTNFLDLEVDSLLAVRFAGEIADALNIELDPTHVYDCGNLNNVFASLNSGNFSSKS